MKDLPLPARKAAHHPRYLWLYGIKTVTTGEKAAQVLPETRQFWAMQKLVWHHRYDEHCRHLWLARENAIGVLLLTSTSERCVNESTGLR